jgi:HD superfamily phosphodiesterase
MEHSISAALRAMIAYDKGDPKRIHHLLKVHSFSHLIGLGERLDDTTQYILELAAIVHDIGIHKAEQIYGCSRGPYQEELGPAEADTLLTSLDISRDVIDRVMYLVGHHHTYTEIDGLDYQILVEADFLVNFQEGNQPASTIRQVYETLFRTSAGKQLLCEIYDLKLETN